MLNTHRFLILHSMPYYSPCLFYEMLFLNLLLFCFFKYQKQHFQLYCWKQVNNSIWADSVDALCDFPSDITAYGLSSSRPVHTANVAAILHFDPLPSHRTFPCPPPLYLCLVSREKNKAPYVLVLENTWINVLFLCKNCATSCFYCTSVRRHGCDVYPAEFLHPGSVKAVIFMLVPPLAPLVVQPPHSGHAPCPKGLVAKATKPSLGAPDWRDGTISRCGCWEPHQTGNKVMELYRKTAG